MTDRLSGEDRTQAYHAPPRTGKKKRERQLDARDNSSAQPTDRSTGPEGAEVGDSRRVKTLRPELPSGRPPARINGREKKSLPGGKEKTSWKLTPDQKKAKVGQAVACRL